MMEVDPAHSASDSSAAPSEPLTVVLAGNPNSGKTTLFNALTGLRQKVANYPGVTVERKEGRWSVGDKEAVLVDLPGLYSLDATSPDEKIARDVLTSDIPGIARPDVVIAVVDATNLERHLYLVTQLVEFGVPVVVALTMCDQAEKQGTAIDVAAMSETLRLPVVPVRAHLRQGIEELRDAVGRACRERTTPTVLWNAESDEAIHESASVAADVKSQIFARYRFISEVFQRSVTSGAAPPRLLTTRIDAVLTHRVFGPLILIGILMLVFQAIFSWASLPMDLLESVFAGLGQRVRESLPPGALSDLLVDGVIAGVGGVLVFLPQILLMFLFISLLEDTGYMARAAFLLDKLMSGIGLHGKAFLPLISSFACAIPGIMATRTIENQRDRLATILVAPLMSCSARLPVYSLMIATFFASQKVFGFVSLGALLMLVMYGIGIFTAIIAAFILKRTVLKSPPAPFVMELPAYRLPNLRGIVQQIQMRASLFVKNAGTVILAISIVLWALTYFPRHDESHLVEAPAAAGAAAVTVSLEAHRLEDSYAGRIGRLIEPVLAPIGFDWKIGVGLIASFAAREVFVSTMSILYNAGDSAEAGNEGLVEAVRNAKDPVGKPAWTPLTAVTLMVFFVLAMQCMSTVAIVRRETNSWGWALFMVGYMTVLAYSAAFVTYQGGRLLGF